MSAVLVKKRKGETDSSLIYRFGKRIQQSGVLKEARKRKFSKRTQNKTARRRSAAYKAKRKEEVTRLRKLGKF
ncbi:MAG: hypothetical protein HYS87_02150 [Candidatus Colwellbacteria bacterium]|nr:hypothetical protein [Candidatus Colwellbacteria bacterium]